ncbi:anoctamin-5-like isoform X2 [Coccinella septempunctata]|uniref:anoctamin-5-like isoform X2 n=1 Tax=Coccinella septempunctata TaxID=41139 RepID=UPI001D07BA70|nr:anoctamin-5-like isoform X2 [Coccinella septempunctata]
MHEIEQKLFSLRKFRKDDDTEPTPYHFRDGTRRIHYVLVLQDTAIYKKEVLGKVLDYLSYLELQGLEFEFEIGVMPTSCEKIVLLNKLLSDPLTIDDREVYGLDKMTKLGYIKDSFPLHDGPWQWTDVKQENLNDRQLLTKYWANYSMWYKEQPINLVAKYFGTDMAFYFAWFEHYNHLLIVVAIVGIIVLCVNGILLLVYPSTFLEDLCSSEEYLCPMCDTDMCRLLRISKYCSTTKAEFVIGNYNNVIYAVIISIWVTVFLESWRRKECTLSVRWNVHHADVEYKIRYDYKDKSTYRKKSNITGEVEPYVPHGIKILRYSFTYFIVFLMVLLVSSYVFLLVLLKNWLMSLMNPEHEPMSTFWTTVIYSIFQVIFIKVFSLFYIKLSVWLTDMEVPKTQKQYNDSVISKIYLFGFINNYIPILYTAFLRGQLNASPDSIFLAAIFEKDYCFPTGCILILAIQLCVVMSLKSIGGNIFGAISRCIKDMLFSASQTKTVTETKMYVPSWEKEYYLEKTNEQSWACEFSEMILQFGYVSFFMAAFPLVGVIAIFNNFMEFRSDAIKLVRGYRRPAPNMINGIGAWNDIIKFASYFSIVCNAFLVAFNTSFIQGVVYNAVYHRGTEGFFNFTFSRFAIEDLPKKQQIATGKENITECLYHGYRYPSEHPKKYERTDDHYLVLIWKFTFVMIFENVILMIIGGIYYFVDEMPRRVKEQLHRERLFTKEVKMKLLQGKVQSRVLKSSSTLKQK